jgi:hypothetical protein
MRYSLLVNQRVFMRSSFAIEGAELAGCGLGAGDEALKGAGFRPFGAQSVTGVLCAFARELGGAARAVVGQPERRKS